MLKKVIPTTLLSSAPQSDAASKHVYREKVIYNEHELIGV